MIITANDHSCFSLDSNDTKIVTDPYDDTTFVHPLRLTADFVTISHEHFDHAFTGAITNDDFTAVRSSCAFENVVFTVIDTFHDNVQGQARGQNRVFIIDFENLRIVHLGDLGHPLSKEQIDLLGEVDILFIPIGGIYTIDAPEAAKLTRRIAAKLTIPMHFNSPELKMELGELNRYLELMTGDFLINTAAGKSINLYKGELIGHSIIAFKQA